MTHKFNDTQSKFFSVCKAKISRQINDIRDTGPDTENTDHGQVRIWVFRIENFEKPYNKIIYHYNILVNSNLSEVF